MKDKVSFRFGSREDDGKLVMLLNETFRTPVSVEHWRWFMNDNPNGINRVYVMQDTENIPVGCYCVSPLVIQYNGQRYVSGFGHHLVVHPTYRDAHNFMQFSRYVFECEIKIGTTILIGPPNKNSYQAHKVLAGYKNFAFMDCLCKLTPQSKSHECRQVEIFTDEYDVLLRTISASHSFSFEKNTAWLNWRYIDCPKNPYTTFAFYESDKLQGFIVLKRWKEESGYHKAHIMDMWALTDLAASQLLDAADHYSDGCDELNLWCVDGYPYRKKLEESGFIQRDSARQPIITRPLVGDIPSLPDGVWSFMYGDADGY